MENNKCIATWEVFELAEVIKPYCKNLTKLGQAAYAGVRLNCSNMYVTNNHFIVKTAKPEVINVKDLTVMPVSKQSAQSKNGLPSVVVSESAETVISQNGETFTTSDRGYAKCEAPFESVEGKKPVIKIGLNAEYLHQLAKYLSSGSQDCYAVLEIFDDTTPIRVTGSRKDAVALLGPRRVD